MYFIYCVPCVILFEQCKKITLSYQLFHYLRVISIILFIIFILITLCIALFHWSLYKITTDFLQSCVTNEHHRIHRENINNVIKNETANV